MPSLKSLKNRVKSVRSTQKITKAMKMVAASKLKRAREAAEAAAPYADKMNDIVQALAQTAERSHEGQRSLLAGSGLDKVHLVIVGTSDRGLCGAFNQSIVKFARKKIDDLLSDGKEVKLICIGKKGYDLLKAQHSKRMVKHIDGIGRKGVKFEEASQVAEYVLEMFEKAEFDYAHFIFSTFKSVISQIVTDQQLIPLPLNEVEEGVVISSPYDYEPAEEEILEKLLPKNVAVQIYRGLLENLASEQGARMSAMDNATRNSGEMIKKLNLVYNRTRQAYITKELSEIISGSEALN
jgi:F-type H+-transporting ATPase subunit gamma